MKTALLTLLFLSASLFAFSAEKTPKAARAAKAGVAASFPGGDGAFSSFKSSVLNKAIRTGIGQGLPAGSYAVELRFDVDGQGNVSNVRPVSNIGFGLEKAAAAQFATTGRWTPARRDGRRVKATQTETFRFQVL